MFQLNSFFIYSSRPGIQNLELATRIFFIKINKYMKISKTHIAPIRTKIRMANSNPDSPKSNNRLHNASQCPKVLQND